MTSDRELIKQLEKEIGMELEQVSLEHIGEEEVKGFAKDARGHVNGLGLCNLKLGHVPEVLSKFQRLEKLDLYSTQIRDISSLKELRGLIAFLAALFALIDSQSFREFWEKLIG